MQSALHADDPRWDCRNVIELSSAALDTDKFAVGSSPFFGDAGGTGIAVPAAPTTALNNRYLFRLCGVDIPAGRAVIIRALRQLATIRQVETLEPGGFLRPVELEVTSPLWSFVDGNVSWHLRRKGQNIHRREFDAAQTPGTSPAMDGLDSALLYVPPLAPYTAPGGGLPPGSGAGMGDLATFRDMRDPWNNAQWNLEVLVRGPGAVVFYASVRQTDPDTRGPALVVADPGAMRPEDRFLATFQDARYGRVAGGMIVETLPCCP